MMMRWNAKGRSPRGCEDVPVVIAYQSTNEGLKFLTDELGAEESYGIRLVGAVE